jgi:uncharacterized protein with HEPN domain
MNINKYDLSFLEDIYDRCIKIKEFTKGMKFYHFTKDTKTVYAVERAYEVIGIATNKISKETKDALSHIPWGEIVALRNKIAHEYDEILLNVLWWITKNSVPELIKELKKINELKPYIKGK